MGPCNARDASFAVYPSFTGGKCNYEVGQHHERGESGRIIATDCVSWSKVPTWLSLAALSYKVPAEVGNAKMVNGEIPPPHARASGGSDPGSPRRPASALRNILADSCSLIALEEWWEGQWERARRSSCKSFTFINCQ